MKRMRGYRVDMENKKYVWHQGFTVRVKREYTCEEQERMAEEQLENSLLSSDVGFRRYARENQI